MPAALSEDSSVGLSKMRPRGCHGHSSETSRGDQSTPWHSADTLGALGSSQGGVTTPTGRLRGLPSLSMCSQVLQTN